VRVVVMVVHAELCGPAGARRRESAGGGRQGRGRGGERGRVLAVEGVGGA
jgi:hypothetical protein